MEIKKKDFKSFNNTNSGKKMFVLGVVGIVMLMVGGFFVGFFETDNVNEVLKLLIELISILGGYFVGMYIGSLIQYTKCNK